jgi:hypothetical protein
MELTQTDNITPKQEAVIKAVLDNPVMYLRAYLDGGGRISLFEFIELFWSEVSEY